MKPHAHFTVIFQTERPTIPAGTRTVHYSVVKSDALSAELTRSVYHQAYSFIFYILDKLCITSLERVNGKSCVMLAVRITNCQQSFIPKSIGHHTKNECLTILCCYVISSIVHHYTGISVVELVTPMTLTFCLHT